MMPLDPCVLGGGREMVFLFLAEEFLVLRLEGMDSLFQDVLGHGL